MNKYKKLIGNTILFGIGTFSSKVLVLLLMPLYTRVLTPLEYGLTDNLVQASNFVLPLITIGTLNGVIRFGLDKAVDKADVFTTSLFSILSGFAVFLLLYPLLGQISFLSGYIGLVYLYALTSSMRSLCSQFVRAQQRVRLYALDGVLATATVIGFNILFLVVLRMGVAGYILAIIASDLCSALFLFIYAGLWRFIRPRRGIWSVSSAILRYSIPLIPTTIFWWIINISSRYIITYKLGNEINGFFVAANKLPMMIVLVANLFNDAWQMSAIADVDGREREDFFNKVFTAFSGMMFLSASGIILFSKVIMRVMVDEIYYTAWRYAPISAIAMAFSCMVTFLGSVYIVQKRSALSLITVMVGAVLNVVLGFALVERFGANGAAMAMLVSYFVVFVLRAYSAKRLMGMVIGVPRMALNMALVSAQAFIMIKELPLWALWEIILTSLVIAINLRPLLLQLAGMLKARKNKAGG